MKDKYLRKLQLTELEILKEIDKFCNENNIKYFLIGGTLLGAVRHKGFIPWDDDIDIGMMREDYDRFTELCKAGKFNDKYFFQCFETDKDYYLGFGKVRKNKTTFGEEDIADLKTHKGIFVDIFPYDNVPSKNGFKQKLQAFIVKNILDAISYKKKIYKLSHYYRKYAVWFFSLFPNKFLIKTQDWLSRIWNKKECEYIVCLPETWSYEKSTFKKDVIFPLNKVSFEDSFFNGQNNNDAYLTQSYGDYMVIPKKSDQKTHKPLIISFTEGEEWKHEN